MDMDNFLKSQTFKTGMFVLLVIFALLLVFKLGVLHGYKKANFSHGYGAAYHRTIHSTVFGHQRGAISNYKRGTFNKEMFERVLLKKQLIKSKAMSDSEVESESDSEEIAE